MPARLIAWTFPTIDEGKPTEYNWIVQHIDHFKWDIRRISGPFHISTPCMA